MLDSVLRRLPPVADPNVLVGYDTCDDAGVYRLSDELALVHTVDFFTPIVDDPYVFGQVAAANSLSDVYAMGGRPVSALAILGFPAKGDLRWMEQILLGGLERMRAAECTVLGGHSVRDEELKFGYAVTGFIHPQKIWRNVGARAGDCLLLTKPLGTGLISTALKQGWADQAAVDAAVAAMVTLNRAAAAALAEVEAAWPGASPVHAVTDVTGFGLLGHLREMAVGSGVSIEVNHRALPVLPGALEAARQGALAGGLKANQEFLEGCVEFAAGVAEEYRCLTYDPQTSGGLLVALASEALGAAQEALARRDITGWCIGRVLERRTPLLKVI